MGADAPTATQVAASLPAAPATAFLPVAALSETTTLMAAVHPVVPPDAGMRSANGDVQVAAVTLSAPTQDAARASTADPSPVSPETLERASRTEASIDKKMVAQSPAQRAELFYRQAGEMAASGHNGQALDRALEAVQADPAHLAARRLVAILLCEKSRFDEAVTVLRDGLQRTPGEPQLAYLLARVKAETGDREAALSLLVPVDTLSGEGHALRAAILSQQGLYAQALPSFEASLRANPNNTAGWLGLAVALDAQGDSSQARQAFQRARDVGAVRGDLSGELQTYIEQKLAALR